MSDTPRTDALIKPHEKDMVVLFNEMLEHARQDGHPERPAVAAPVGGKGSSN